jgi:hypothetical protein
MDLGIKSAKEILKEYYADSSDWRISTVYERN